MVPQHVWISMSNGLPDEGMAGLVYPIGYRMKTLPTNTAQHTYKRFFFFFFFGRQARTQVLQAPAHASTQHNGDTQTSTRAQTHNKTLSHKVLLTNHHREWAKFT